MNKHVSAQIRNQLTDSQHGFRAGRSTATNHINFVNYVAAEMDAGKQVDAVYLDFEKAFDRVDNDLLFLFKKMYGYYPFLYPSLYVTGMVGLDTLELRRKMILMVHYYQLLHNKIDNSTALESVSLYVPDGYMRGCLPKKSGQCPYLVPQSGACEWSCRSDAECSGGERCCATGCGTACTQPVHQTACQQRRALALHTAAESGNPPAWAWVPQCTEDGAYQEVQCRRSDKTCWCVDTAGNEIPGTRTSNSTPTCASPIECPETNCNDIIACAHGQELDRRGCPTCECRDPCAEAKCKPDESCELVPLDCEGAVCPPLARCAPSLRCPDSTTPLGAPEGLGSLICGPNAAACPSTHACRFAPHDSGPNVCCPKPRTVCFESKDEGNCTEGQVLNTTRWHFNHERNRCERFRYHGCSGNHQFQVSGPRTNAYRSYVP
ncbi:keratin-associated protein 10-5-like, partial [Bombyx mandarina]|uniref:Keratin-associated protein 10-5-like n=1 Tax=Bombyx mandarina TaxID=7092 RepID=A0A6J2KNM6_BOMMA